MSMYKKVITKVSTKINANAPTIKKIMHNKIELKEFFKYFSELRKMNE